MSIAELKKTADSLNARERQWLRSYLFVSERIGSEKWKHDIADKRRAFQAGKGVSEARYKRRTTTVESRSS